MKNTTPENERNLLSSLEWLADACHKTVYKTDADFCMESAEYSPAPPVLPINGEYAPPPPPIPCKPAPPIPADLPDTHNQDGITYQLEGKVYKITGADKSITVANIPAALFGVPVTSISHFAFTRCTSLTSVTIPDSVTSIGEYAFKDCTSLTSITIPDSVTYIGEAAFLNCSSLTSVTIGNGVKSISYSAFLGCSSLTSVHFAVTRGWRGGGRRVFPWTLKSPARAAEQLRTHWGKPYTRK